MTAFKLIQTGSVALLAALVALPAYADNGNNWLNGMYIEGQMGISLPRDSKSSLDFSGVTGDLPLEYGRDLVLSASVGTYITSNIRAEAELGYRSPSASTEDVTVAGIGTFTALDEGLKTKVITFMLNGWYDIPTGTKWTPYVGGGVGLARLSADTNDASVLIVDDSDTVFAYQLGAGTSYALNDHVSLTAGYHYLDTATAKFDAAETLTPSSGTAEDDFSSHELKMGMRYRF